MSVTPRHIGINVRRTLSGWLSSRMLYESNSTKNGSEALIIKNIIVSVFKSSFKNFEIFVIFKFQVLFDIFRMDRIFIDFFSFTTMKCIKRISYSKLIFL